VRIEADNEPSQYPQPGLLNDADLLDVVASQVLKLSGFPQRFPGRRLDADENAHEVRFHHGRKQFGPVRQVDGGLGVKRKGSLMALLPHSQVARQQQSLAVIADEVVVDNEYLVAPAEPAQRVEFLDHLGRRLCSRPPSADRDNVAEFALKRAPARELY